MAIIDLLDLPEHAARFALAGWKDAGFAPPAGSRIFHTRPKYTEINFADVGCIYNDQTKADHNSDVIDKLMAAIPAGGLALVCSGQLYISRTIKFPYTQLSGNMFSIPITVRGVNSNVSHIICTTRTLAIDIHRASLTIYPQQNTWIELRDLTVTSLGEGCRITFGGKSVWITRCQFSKCEGEYGLKITGGFNGGVLSEVVCTQNAGVGCILEDITMVNITQLVTRNNKIGVVIKEVNGLYGGLYSENNKEYGAVIYRMRESSVDFWLEANWGAFDRPQAILRQCENNRIGGKTGFWDRNNVDLDATSHRGNDWFQYKFTPDIGDKNLFEGRETLPLAPVLDPTPDPVPLLSGVASASDFIPALDVVPTVTTPAPALVSVPPGHFNPWRYDGKSVTHIWDESKKTLTIEVPQDFLMAAKSNVIGELFRNSQMSDVDFEENDMFVFHAKFQLDKAGADYFGAEMANIAKNPRGFITLKISTNVRNRVTNLSPSPILSDLHQGHLWEREEYMRMTVNKEEPMRMFLWICPGKPLEPHPAFKIKIVDPQLYKVTVNEF